jgi:tetratricopeptide (TPR) repeat protein
MRQHIKRGGIQRQTKLGSPLELACQKGVNLMDQKRYDDAQLIFKTILRENPTHYAAQMNQGVCLLATKQYDKAAKIFHVQHAANPRDLKALYYCGVSFEKIGEFEFACKFLERYLKEKPHDFSAWIMLGSAFSKSRNHIDALKCSMKALSLEPTRALAYNNLGATLMDVERFEEARAAFDTALTLEPGSLDVRFNLASLETRNENYHVAIDIFEDLLSLHTKDSVAYKSVAYSSSFAYLGTGQLQIGWERYDEGFAPIHYLARTPKRKFTIPQWNGEDIQEKRLLVWGEQGLGDEFWFFSMLKEAQQCCESLLIECQPRLVTLLQRSFPDATVRASQLGPLNRTDYDVQIPAASLCRIFRSHMVDFAKFKPYIQPDPKLILKFSERLQALRPKRLVGICWRSGIVDAQRSKGMLSLSDLAPILCMENIEIVNLQYGDCEREIVAAEQALNIKIHRWPDVDLKDNQEQLAAIMSQMDMILTTGTAVMQLAGAMGCPTIAFQKRTSVFFLGQSQSPWFSSIRSFATLKTEPLKNQVKYMQTHLQELFQAKKK